MKKSLSLSFLWKLLERFGVTIIQFILQLVLARLLDPEHHGTLAIMTIFVSLASIFIQTGFSTALIQNKDVTEEDYSSVFWISLLIAAILYVLIFLVSPLIATFYNMPSIVNHLRVLALMLFPGALNSIQMAKVSREMDFRNVFFSSIAGVAISGAASILVAYLGGGLWALVVQNLLNVSISCIVMFFSIQWRPRLVCNFKRLAHLFDFGWKLLVSNLLDTLDEHLQNLIVGKKYNSTMLGYYNRGVQFPQFLISSIVSAVQSVLLPAMSAEQDDTDQVKALVKASITMSSYIVFPMMAGLACVAEPMVRLLLTDKWLPCVPYIQVNCFIFAFYTVHVCNLQAINAMGRSDLFLKLEIIKKSYELVLIAIAVFCFDSPMAIAMTGVITTAISWYINAAPNKKLTGYPFAEQLLDLLPLALITVTMSVCVLYTGYLCELTGFSCFLTLIIEVVSGIAVYLVISYIVKPQPYRMLLSWIKNQRNSIKFFIN